MVVVPSPLECASAITWCYRLLLGPERRDVKAEPGHGDVGVTDDGDAEAASVLIAMGTPQKVRLLHIGTVE